MPAPQPAGRLGGGGVMWVGVEAGAGQQVPRCVGDAGELQRVGGVARLHRGVVQDEDLGVVGAELLGKGAVQVDGSAHRGAAPVTGDDGDGERRLRLAGREVQGAADVLVVDAADRVGAVSAIADILVAVQRAGPVDHHGDLPSGLRDAVAGG